MLKQSVKYGVTLIGLYLVVANASNSGKVISSGANGVATVTKTLQGR